VLKLVVAAIAAYRAATAALDQGDEASAKLGVG